MVFVMKAIFPEETEADLQKERAFAVGKSLFCFLLIFLLGLGAFYKDAHRSYDLHKYLGETRTFTGRVFKLEERSEERYYIILHIPCDKIHGKESEKSYRQNRQETSFAKGKRNEKVLLRVSGYIKGSEKITGRELTVTGILSQPERARNPNCFDYQKLLQGKGIGSIIDAKASSLYFESEKAYPLKTFSDLIYCSLGKIEIIKSSFQKLLSQKLDQRQYALALGMLFGNKNFIEEETLLSFQHNATAHILAVSGLHVGILYASLLLIIGLAGKKNSRPANLFVLVIVLIYVAMSGFSPSSIRAFFIVFFHVVCKFFHLRFDLFSGTLLSLLLVLLIRPCMVYNAGLQMSYLALFSLVFINPFFKKFIPLKTMQYLAPCLSIQIGLAPLIAYHFNYLSFISLLANIPSILITGLLLPLMMILMIFASFFSGLITDTLTLLVSWGLDLLIIINDFLYVEGKTSILVPSPHLLILAFITFTLFFSSSELAITLWKRKIRKPFLVFALIVFLAGGGLYGVMERPLNNAKIIFLDVGQGDCLFIETEEGKTIMIDSGGQEGFDVGRKVLLPFLLKNGYKTIDLAIATHLHKDHFGGFESLSQEINIRKLLLYEGYREKENQIISETGFKKENIYYGYKGMRILCGGGVYIDILSPIEWVEGRNLDMIDENEISLVLKITYKDITMLMTGDIDSRGELSLGPNVKCDVLKISHHGSRFSSSEEFLKRVNPSLGVIQVGRNYFGHPHPQVIEKCLKEDIMILRNDLEGAIGLGEGKKKEGKIWIKTMLTKNLLEI